MGQHEPIWANLEPTWGQHGPPLVRLVANLSQHGPTWGQLGANLGQLEANGSQDAATWGCLGANTGHHGCTRPTWGHHVPCQTCKISVSPRREHDFYEIVRFIVDTRWKALGMPWEVLCTPWVDVWVGLGDALGGLGDTLEDLLGGPSVEEPRKSPQDPR